MKIAFHNRLCLSLSKRTRHELIVKINGKRRPRNYDALGQILVDYSCARHASAPIASPHPVRRGEASEHAHVSSFLFSFTHL
jgi:hypothetical protein